MVKDVRFSSRGTTRVPQRQKLPESSIKQKHRAFAIYYSVQQHNERITKDVLILIGDLVNYLFFFKLVIAMVFFVLPRHRPCQRG